MTDTPVRPYPQTPAEVAAAVLDAIEAQPATFNMLYWAYLPLAVPLTPETEPTCGTTLCAAGWAAHVTGWTLVDLPGDEFVEVTERDSNGGEYPAEAGCYAEKDGERRLISDVARDVLGLTEAETFWSASGAMAITRLQAISGR